MASVRVDARILGLGAGSLIALALLSVALLLRARGAPSADLAHDPRLRQQLVEELAARTLDNFDSHPDPEVGHVHLPGERRNYHGLVHVNAQGLREVEVPAPREPGSVRIVLLGDSYVFGWRVEEHERFGARLAEFLRARGGPAARVEVVHLGVVSWNLVGACQYLRRRLDELAPDLVIQVTVSNDLDDPQGVRGNGLLASFSTDGPGPGNALVYHAHPRDELGSSRANFLAFGWGHETRTRFEAAGAALAELRAALAARPEPVPHLLLVNWGQQNSAFHTRLGHTLEPGTVVYLPLATWDEYRLDAQDSHWNPAGHEAVARRLYAWIRARGWLPGLALSPWPAAEAEASASEETGRAEAERELELPELMPSLAFPGLRERPARQVLGGIDQDGVLAPYASVLLPEGARLRLAGTFLPDAVLAGAHVQVFLDEFPVGELVVEPSLTFTLEAELPEAARGRRAVSVRLAADDWVYRGDDLRRCAVARIAKIALR